MKRIAVTVAVAALVVTASALEALKGASCALGSGLIVSSTHC